MLQRDIQSELAVKVLAALTTFAIDTPATNYSAAIDTSLNNGFDAISVALQTDRPLAAGDIATFTYKFQESDSGTGDWTDVVVDGTLPYRKNPDRSMVIAADNYIQTVGVFSTKKFIRLAITGEAKVSALNITPIVILRSLQVEFTGYDPAVVPDDGQP